MRGLNFKNLKDDQPGVIAVESERRLLLPCGEVAIEIVAMVEQGRLSGAGPRVGLLPPAWTVKFVEDWVRVDYGREALGLPTA